MPTTRPSRSRRSAPILTNVPTAIMGTSAAETRRAVLTTRCTWDTLAYVYVLDSERHLRGVISLKELLCADDDAHIETVMIRNPIAAHLTTDREHIAMLAIQHRIKAVPVVNDDRAFLGVIGTDDILQTLHEEHVEDFLQFAGIRRTGAITDILTARIGLLIHLRLPWLIVGLIGSMIGTLVVQAFEGVLTREFRLAFFIPLIVYMSDALGTQTQTLYIRSLAMERIPLGRTFVREFAVTLGIGAACAALLFAFAGAAFRSLALAWTVSLALFLTMLTAAGLALGVTALLQRSGRDPALGGGPLATVIQDVASILIYFLVASALIL